MIMGAQHARFFKYYLYFFSFFHYVSLLVYAHTFSGKCKGPIIASPQDAARRRAPVAPVRRQLRIIEVHGNDPGVKG